MQPRHQRRPARAGGFIHLRSRGIGEAEARKLLCLGFAGEILEAYSQPTLRERAEWLIRSRLERGTDTSTEG